MLFQICGKKWWSKNPANIYLFNVNNRNTRKRCEIWSKLTIKTPERRPERSQWRRFGVFIVNFEHNLHLFLVSLFFDFEQVYVSYKSNVDNDLLTLDHHIIKTGRCLSDWPIGLQRIKFNFIADKQQKIIFS